VPIEVRQIGIRLAIGEGDGAPASGGPNGDDTPRLTRAQRARMVDECVRAVLAQLRADRER